MSLEQVWRIKQIIGASVICCVCDSETQMAILDEKFQTPSQQQRQGWGGGDPRQEPESVVI